MYIKEFLTKLFLFGMAFYLVNIGYLTLFNLTQLNVQFHTMHLFYFVASALALIITAKIFQKNKDIVGVSFLVISSVLTLAVFVFGKWFFVIETPSVKWNYFLLFTAYLFAITFLIGQKLNQIKF